jgi:hypothetical protein
MRVLEPESRVCIPRLVIRRENFQPQLVHARFASASLALRQERAADSAPARQFAYEPWTTVRNPRTFVTGGTHLFALVPELLRIKVPDGHLLQRGYMIAVSDDGDESWKFVSDSVKRKELLRIFPDFPSILPLPGVPEPEPVP